MKYPWIAWYPAEYISKTRSLTMKQHGAYCLLLWEYYINGPLVANATVLLRICCSPASEDWADVLYVLEKFFVLLDGFWHHKRADEEIKRRSSLSKQRQLAGSRGGLAKATNLLKQKATQSQSHIKPLELKGEVVLNSSGKTNGKTSLSPQYTKLDHEEKQLRLIAGAEKKIADSLRASVGAESTLTERQFVEMVCDEVGITVSKYFELKEKQHKWPSQITPVP